MMMVDDLLLMFAKHTLASKNKRSRNIRRASMFRRFYCAIKRILQACTKLQLLLEASDYQSCPSLLGIERRQLLGEQLRNQLQCFAKQDHKVLTAQTAWYSHDIQNTTLQYTDHTKLIRKKQSGQELLIARKQ